MRLAVHDGARIQATPKAKGTCPACGADMIAKCGTIKVWHWAHRGRRHCDPWWEPETEWHRAWKSEFPEDWNEVVVRSDADKFHIADVRLPTGKVIEFQHSHISCDDRYAREAFYGDMIWVVDGTRLERDKKILHFLQIGYGISKRRGQSIVNGSAHQITKRWASSTKLVFLDFGEDDLWCISPRKENWMFFAARYLKRDFVDAFLAGKRPKLAKPYPDP